MSQDLKQLVQRLVAFNVGVAFAVDLPLSLFMAAVSCCIGFTGLATERMAEQMAAKMARRMVEGGGK